MRARGAMPDALPSETPFEVARAPLLPPAVDAVCVPWPPCPVSPATESRGDKNSVQCSADVAAR